MARLLHLAAAVAVLVVAYGCSGSGSDQATEYDSYVALGDSYTAAPGVPPTDATSSFCQRSGRNYPALLAAALPRAAVTDVSCSGAGTGSMTAPEVVGTASVPAQFDALTADTDLVTVGLGANDGGLFGGVVNGCVQLAASDPVGSPCQNFWAARTPGIDDLLNGITFNLAGVLDGIRQRSPHARVVVVGYPQLVPASGTCAALPLAAADYPFVRDVTQRLSEALRTAAEQADADYVDVWKASEGHDICADEPWVNGATETPDTAIAFHPLAVEQQAVAELVLDQVG